MRIAIVMTAAMALGCGAATGRSSGDGGVADMAVQTGPEANPPKLGTLTLNSVFFTGFADASAGASFTTYAGSATGPCSLQAAGSCRVRSCPKDGDLGSAAPGPARTPVGAGMMTLTQDASGYSLSLGSAEPWTGGESFTMAVTGDVVPAFSLSVSAPSRPRISSPPKPASGAPPLAVSRGSGLPIAWTASSPGTLTIDVYGETASAAFDVLCDVATSAGSYTVSSDALAGIPAGATNTAVSARISTVATAMAGDWPITFTARDAANDAASGTLWIFDITLQ
ncbi:MAG TPA: hypothetical protein VGH63_02880 [Polyangia bacterium]